MSLNRSRGSEAVSPWPIGTVVAAGLCVVVGVVVCARGLMIEGGGIIVLAAAAAWFSRREVREDERTDLGALDLLDPGGTVDELEERVQRIAAQHRDEVKQVRAGQQQLERSVTEKDEQLKKARNRAAEDVKKARRESEQVARWLDDVPGILFRLDGDGVVQWANTGAEHLMPGAVGTPFREFVRDWSFGQSGPFDLHRGEDAESVPVWIEALSPDLASSDVVFLLLRDLSAERALEAAADAAHRAQENYRDVRAGIAPQPTPEGVLEDTAPRLASLLSAKTLMLARSRDGADTIRIASFEPSDGGENGRSPGASTEMAPSDTFFADVLRDGEERVILNLDESDLADEERRSLRKSGVGALGVFPLREGDDVLAALAIGFERSGDLSPGAVAMARGLVPSVARAVAAGRAFEAAESLTRRWAWVVEELPDPVVLATPQGKIRACNQKARLLNAGLDADGAGVELLAAADAREGMRTQFAEAVGQGRGRFVVDLATSAPPSGDDQPDRIGEVHLRVAEEDGESMVLVVVRDVSRQRAETEEVHRREEEVEELYQLSLSLGRSLDLAWVMEQVFEKALEVTKLDCGWVTFIEQETDSREVAAAHKVDLERVTAFYDENGHVGYEDRVLRTKKPVVLESLAEDPTIPPKAVEKAGLRSLVSVPLLLEGEVVGILNLASPESYQFQIKDIENLGTFGRIFSRGVANSKRFYEMRRRVEQSKRLISEQLERIRALGDAVGEADGRIRTYRELLVALWGKGGAMKAIADRVATPDGRDEWELAFAVGKVLPLYLDDGERARNPAALNPLLATLAKADDQDNWTVPDDLGHAEIDAPRVSALIAIALEGLRPITEKPYDVTAVGQGAEATLDVTIDALEPLGSAAEIEEQIESLESLPPGRAYLVLVLLHLLRRALGRVGVSLVVLRGEGQLVTMRVGFGVATEDG